MESIHFGDLAGLAVAIVGIVVGVTSLIEPGESGELFKDPSREMSGNSLLIRCLDIAMRTFGIPPKVDTHASCVALMRVIGSRNMTYGVAMIACYFQGQHKAFATMLMGNMVAGTIDGIMIRRVGSKREGTGHLLGAVVVTALGAWLWRTS